MKPNKEASEGAQKQPAPDKLEIKVAAHVVVQLGRELVTDEEQALLELVKNAYDANSPDCEIILEPDWTPNSNDPRLEFLSQPEVATFKQQSLPGLEADSDVSKKKNFPPLVGRIRVVDNGDGAAPADVHQSWLTVSFSAKRPEGEKTKVAKEGSRVPVGDKGLGRLATMKLGRVLTFKTAIPDSPNETVTSFSWDDFSVVTSVDQVRVREVESPRDNDERGSTVEILGLHDTERWKSQESLTRLIGRLSKLVNPFNPIPDFLVTVTQKGKPHELQDVVKAALPFAPAQFEFSWDGRNLSCTSAIQSGLFRGNNNDEAKLSHNRVFSNPTDAELFINWIKNHKKYSKKIPIVDSKNESINSIYTCKHTEDLDSFPIFQKYPGAKNPGAFKANFYYFLFNAEEISRLKTVGSSPEQIQSMSGISIYRDGFKVRMTDDWIGLSEGTTSGGFYFLRPKNTLGYFELTNEFNPELTEKSDREGFVDSDAYRGLMALAQKCRDWTNGILSSSREAFTEYNRKINSTGDDVPTLKGTMQKIKSTSSKLKNELDSAKDRIYLTTQKFEQVKTHLEQLDSNTTINLQESKRVISEALSAAKGSFANFQIHFESIQGKAAVLSNASGEFESFHTEERAKHLRLLEAASVGLSARILVHELHTYLDRIEDASRSIIRLTNSASNPEVRRISVDLSSATRELRKIVATIDPLLPGTRSLKENFSASKIIKDFLDGHATLANNFNINFEITGIDEFSCLIRFNRTRFIQILENLLQNSIYWIQRSKNKNPGRIVIACKSDGFDWSDSGDGIDKSIEESLFEAFETKKPVGEGQGLGLHIVQTFLEAENCSITLNQERNNLNLRYIFNINLTGALQNK